MDPDPDHNIFLAAVTEIDISFFFTKGWYNVRMVSNKQEITVKVNLIFFDSLWQKMFNKQNGTGIMLGNSGMARGWR
jgi:hypothetical protein